jgi:hypothetical protein
MSVDEAVDQHVVQRLEDTFGKAVTMLIVASATRESGVPTSGLNANDFRKFVDAVCSDQRVVDMWGAAEAEAQRQMWCTLV